MSLILDALNRAEADRAIERGPVPDLRARLSSSQTTDPPRANGSKALLWLAIGLLAALLIVALAWRWPDADQKPLLPAVPVAHPPLATPAATPPPTTAPIPEPAPTSASGFSAHDTASAVPRAPASRTPNSTALAEAPKEKPKPVPKLQSAEPDEPRIYAQSELPDSVRRVLPQMAISGSMYSSNASARMLIINNQVLHEGDSVSNDVVLEQIRLKAAVFRYRNYRYRIAY